jgi:nitroreductase
MEYSMEIFEKRKSIRKYKKTAVKDEILTDIIKSAIIAPSGSNTQPWHFIIVDDDELKKTIAKASHNQKWMESAPVFIICVADIRSRIKTNDEILIDEKSELFEVKQIIRDTAIAIEHLVLEAVNKGLGTCWVAWFKQNEIRPILEIPKDKFVVGIITLGYADEDPEPRPRKKIEEIVHRNKW